ncbi:MAG: transglutaminase family protein [Candidatus Aenigmatarchaeota archaeon]
MNLNKFNYMKKFLLLSLILLSTPAFAEITNPQVVSKIRAEVYEHGFIEVSGIVNNIELNLSIPQEDGYQKIESFEVSDKYGICNNQCSYKFVYDKFGNKLLNINWKNPKENIEFKIKAIVSVNRRYSVESKNFQEFLRPTNLVQSTDPEIESIASKARGSDFEKVAYLSKWISENIRYNTVYSDVNIPAKEILKLRIGVCKEFSNLLVSFLRSLGYYSAVAVGYVHPGKIYGGENFLPHGWTEVYANEGIISDPTWGEVGYLDATHIKFATLPDSSWTFSSFYTTGYGSFKASLKSTNVSIKLLSFEESPVVYFNSSFLENRLWKGYAVLKTDLSANGCFLTKYDIRSCTSNDKDFLEIINQENVTYFCNKKSIFTIFKIPDLQKNMRYTCPVSVLFYSNGEQKNILLNLFYSEGGNTKLTVDKNVVSPKEKIVAFAANSYIFSDNGDYGFENLEIFAPFYDFNIYSYNKGSLEKQSIKVVLSKPIDAILDINDTLLEGKSYLLNVHVKNLLNNPQEVTVKFKEQIKKEYVKDLKNFTFNFTPNVNDNLIQVVVSTNDFSTTFSKQVKIIEEKKVEDYINDLFQALISFFKWLFSLFNL